MANRIQYRRDTAANFTAANTVLAAGEPAIETDTKKRKIGDGTTAWTSLGYQASEQKTLDASYARSTRSTTLASLGDSIACNGASGMAVVSLVNAAAIGATTITVTTPETGATMASDYPSDTLVRIGTEYTRTTGSPVAAGANWTLTLTVGLTAAHGVGERVMSVPTIFTATPAPALAASVLSKGQLRFGGVYGHGGYTAEQMKRLYLPMVLEAKPGYCYVMAGRNAGTNAGNPAAGAAAVVDLWDQLLAAGIMPVATTIPPVNGITSQAKQDDQRLNGILIAEARKRGIPMTDLFALLVDPATGEYKTGMNSDATHPSAAGRWVQSQGIWDAIKATIPQQLTGKPVTNAYADTAAYPSPTSLDNAMMLTGGGGSNGAGSTSVVPKRWATSMTDAIGKVETVAAPVGAGNAIKLSRAAGATSAANAAYVQSDATTLVPGHRYRLIADVKTNGLTAAKTADAAMTGFRFTFTHQTFSSTQSFVNVSNQYDDVDGTLAIDFVSTSAQPTAGFFYAVLNGTASTPAYDVTLWNVQLVDLTVLGQDGSSPWPYKGVA